MAKLVADIDYGKRLENLRDSYVTAYPRQRLAIIRQRLEDHHFGPNRLVTSVSAVEGYARSLVLRSRAKDHDALRAAYKTCRKTGPEALIKEYLNDRGVLDAYAFFSEDNWKLFHHAVAFRNVVVHECTYLGLDAFPALIKACEEILRKLEELAGSRGKRS